MSSATTTRFAEVSRLSGRLDDHAAGAERHRPLDAARVVPGEVLAEAEEIVGGEPVRAREDVGLVGAARAAGCTTSAGLTAGSTRRRAVASEATVALRQAEQIGERDAERGHVVGAARRPLEEHREREPLDPRLRRHHVAHLGREPRRQGPREREEEARRHRHAPEVEPVADEVAGARDRRREPAVDDRAALEQVGREAAHEERAEERRGRRDEVERAQRQDGDDAEVRPVVRERQ